MIKKNENKIKLAIKHRLKYIKIKKNKKVLTKNYFFFFKNEKLVLGRTMHIKNFLKNEKNNIFL